MERKEMLAKAKEMGLEFPGNISNDKLEELIEEAEIAAKAESYEVAAPKKEGEKSEADKAAMRKNGLIMKHVVITPLGEHLRGTPSEMFTVMTPRVGTIKKVVQFGVPSLEPVIILDMLKEKKTLIQQKTTVNGKEITRKVQSPAFSIEYLPDLTQEEFEALKAK